MREPYHHGDLRNALIEAGIGILKAEGARALSLRAAALRAGVSHSAPYAHFKDKQALIAAIAARALEDFYQQMERIVLENPRDPLRQLRGIAHSLLEFSLAEPALFRVAFSGVIEHEHDYPEFVEVSHRAFALLVEVVKSGQAVGVLRPGDPELAAVGVWSAAHGFIRLALEHQVPSTLLAEHSLSAMLDAVLDPVLWEQSSAPA